MSRTALAPLRGLSLERAEAKRAQREADAKALASGEKNPAELRRENAHFAGLNVRIDWSRIRAFS
jgi:hypothetical protein